MLEPRPEECQAGDAALARGAWEDAGGAFDRAIATRETPEALEGLGLAGWWLDLADIVFDACERAYRLYTRSICFCKAARRTSSRGRGSSWRGCSRCLSEPRQRSRRRSARSICWPSSRVELEAF